MEQRKVPESLIERECRAFCERLKALWGEQFEEETEELARMLQDSLKDIESRLEHLESRVSSLESRGL